jgi:phage tail-like protein
VTDPGPLGAPSSRCFDRAGCPLPEGAIAAPRASRVPRGQLLTVAIDSGVPRCVWHRARIDADVPPGTNVELSIATGESPAPLGTQTRPPIASGDWVGFAAGAPHPDDWQVGPAGATDFLVQQPPGRWAFLRLRLSGDGTATPTVRRIRLDLPRATSAELLPAVYHEPPEAEDFTARFVSLFDATIADVDAAIAELPALLDVAHVPDDALPWLAGFLDVVLDPAWDPARRRALLAAAPDLYRRRGTLGGLADTIAIVTGTAPAIEELANGRAFDAVGRARLGGVRLFGRARARFAVGASALGQAPISSYGDPTLDALTALAYRIRVAVPGTSAVASARGRAQLERLVERQKPAHVVASVRVGGGALQVGVAAVGVDTAFGRLPPPVLGAAGNVRLSRASALAAGSRGAARFTVGDAAAVGVQTVLS